MNVNSPQSFLWYGMPKSAILEKCQWIYVFVQFSQSSISKILNERKKKLSQISWLKMTVKCMNVYVNDPRLTQWDRECRKCFSWQHDYYTMTTTLIGPFINNVYIQLAIDSVTNLPVTAMNRRTPPGGSPHP